MSNPVTGARDCIAPAASAHAKFRPRTSPEYIDISAYVFFGRVEVGLRVARKPIALAYLEKALAGKPEELTSDAWLGVGRK